MGGEIAEAVEWCEDRGLELKAASDGSPNQGVQNWVRDLNHFYREQPSLWEADFDPVGFQWVNRNDREARFSPSFVTPSRAVKRYSWR